MSVNSNPGRSVGLFDHIQQTQYQTVASESLDPALVAAVAAEEGSSPESENVEQIAEEEESNSEQTTSQATDPLTDKQRELEARQAEFERQQAEFERKQNDARIQEAQAALRREEEQFKAHYDSLDDPAEKRAAIAEFRAQRALRERDFYQQQAATQASQQASQNEQMAKNAVIMTVMTQEKIPEEYLPFLQMAKNVQEFEGLVNQVKTIIAKNQPAQREQKKAERVASGVDAAGGVQAGFVPPAAPKERSGDLMGLIKSRGYQVVPRSE